MFDNSFGHMKLMLQAVKFHFLPHHLTPFYMIPGIPGLMFSSWRTGYKTDEMFGYGTVHFFFCPLSIGGNMQKNQSVS